MKRLILRWLGLLAFVAALAVLFVHLGEWQLDRLAGRQASNAHVIENQRAQAVDYSLVFKEPLGKKNEWRKVVARGTFDSSQEFIVRYRHDGNVAGSEIVTAFRTTSNEWLLVNRGFVPREGASIDPTMVPAPPTGEVEISGFARASETGKDIAATPVNQRIRVINSAVISKATRTPFLDGYVILRTLTPDQGSGLTPIKPPVLDEGPHFWYAVQWFCFTGIAVVGFVVLVRADLRDRKKRRQS